MKDEFGHFEVPQKTIERDTYAGWRFFHLVAAWLMGSLAHASIFAPTFTQNFIFLLLSSGILLIALLLSYFSRIVIYDLFVQMGYREKFGVFISGALIILIPRLLGFEGWTIPFLLLTIVTAFLAYNEVGFGRYYLACLVIICTYITTQPMIFLPIFIGFILVMLITFWLDFVAFRLEEFGSGNSVPLPPILKLFSFQILAPLLISTGAWFGFSALFGKSVRVPVFDPGPVNQGSSVEIDFLNNIIIDAIIVTIIIILLVVLLNWFEKKLRRRKSPVGLDETLVDATEIDRLEINHPTDESLEIAEDDDGRTKVLKRFGQVIAAMKKRGYDRYAGETAQEYLTRISRGLLKKSDLNPSSDLLFLESCYSDHNITDQQAEQYVAYANQLQTEMEEEAHRVIEREVYLEKVRAEQKEKLNK